jgi:CRP-like cAMP-binding protein
MLAPLLAPSVDLARTPPGKERVMRAAKPGPIANSVLAALPRELYRHLLAGLARVTLKFGTVLYEPGDPIRDVYFPNDSVVSLLTLVEGQFAVEVGLVGREGMVGIPLALGIGVSPVRALVQGAGTAMRMNAARFCEELRKSRPLQAELYRYTNTLMAQITQTAACNRFHTVEARLARWLLMTRDRVQSSQIHLTHEFLSHMLGVRRVGVTEAASALQRQKLIEYSRGNIRILDHGGLEAACCSCYELVRDMHDGAPRLQAWNSNSSKGKTYFAATGAAAFSLRPALRSALSFSSPKTPAV